MKELSIEEKAKRYDEALKYARVYYTDGDEDMKMMMKTCFPVLVEESEDERIRKWIIAYLENRIMNTSITDEKDNCLDAIRWLKKQGKTSPIVSNSSKIGKPAWSEEDNDCLNAAINNLEYLKDYCPYREMGLEPAIDWLKSIKDRVQPKHAEWSEEDDSHICNIINWLDVCKAYNQDAESVKLISQHIAWLKSLRPQNHWKPSEEQMAALELAVNDWYGDGVAIIDSLYNDLKKL